LNLHQTSKHAAPIAALVITTNKNILFHSITALDVTTLHHTTLTALIHFPSRWRSANNILLDFTNIAKPNIPISTAAPTHHGSIFNTHLLYSTLFQNDFFKNFLALFMCPRGSSPDFQIPLLPLRIPIFFPTFRPPFLLTFSR